MRRRLFTACLGTETNSFSPIPTGLGLFERTMLVRNGEFGDDINLFALPLVTWRERAHALGWEVSEGLAAFATPAGDTTRDAYESLRDEILEELKRALPVDVVMLSLHGAMVAEGYPDAEGDFLSRVRELLGPQVPLLAELDLHGHQTQLKLESADVLIYFKEYPHTDSIDRAHELFDIAVGMLEKKMKPCMAMYDCKMLGMFATTREPMRGFVEYIKSVEKRPGVLSASLVHGFPWSNMPDIGMHTLVVTDNDQALAGSIARELGDRVWQIRDDIVIPFVSMEHAIGCVQKADMADKPFVLADTADNTGAGAAGDSTYVLRYLMENSLGGFALGPLWDPVAVTLAFEAGVGAQLPMRIGGKSGPASGDPVDCLVNVINLASNAKQPYAGGTELLGDVAWVRIGDSLDDSCAIDVVVNSQRVQAFAPECFSSAGLDPLKPKALIIKSTQHFHAAYAPIAREIFYMKTPGCAFMNFAEIQHERLSRDLWPCVPDPHR